MSWLFKCGSVVTSKLTEWADYGATAIIINPKTPLPLQISLTELSKRESTELLNDGHSRAPAQQLSS